MSISRRRFIKAGAVMSAALMLKPGTLILGRNSMSSHNSPNPDRYYSRETFEPYVGDVFRVRVGKQMVSLQLVALENVSPASRGITTGKVAPTDCFSMRFHAASPLPPRARIHQLNHRKLGSFDLYMSQSKDGGKFLQTAIVNHIA
ncbi:MAG TPA: hypothetical protein VF088_13730 [Pyrinomonadaceae bacterium]